MKNKNVNKLLNIVSAIVAVVVLWFNEWYFLLIRVFTIWGLSTGEDLTLFIILLAVIYTLFELTDKLLRTIKKK